MKQGKSTISLFLVITMVLSMFSGFTADTMSFAVTNSVSIAGSFNSWNAGADTMVSNNGFWEKSITIQNPGNYEYKVVRNGNEWLSTSQYGSSNISFTTTENNQAVRFVFYDGVNKAFDSVNYPNGIKPKMVGNDVQLGNWSLTASNGLMGLNGSDYHSYKNEGLKLNAGQTIQYKIVIDPANSEDWNPQIAGANNGNLEIANTTGAEQNVNVYLDLSNGINNYRLCNTLTDIPLPKANKVTGTELSSTDTLSFSGGTGTLRYELTTDGTVPAVPTVSSAQYAGLDLKSYQGKTIKIKVAYEKYGFVGAVADWAYTVKSDALASPVVSGKDVTFNAVHNGSTLYLAGTFNNWNNAGIQMTKTAEGHFTTTQTLTAGVHEYKFVPVAGSWNGVFTDQLNSEQVNGNSKVIVQGMKVTSADQVMKDTTLTLTAEKVDANGAGTAVTPTWSLKAPVSGITLAVDKLTVSPTVTAAKVIVVATLNGEVVEKELAIIEKSNTYIINYHRYDGNYTNWDLWAWGDTLAGKGYGFNKGLVDNFMRAEYKLSAEKFALIPRMSNWSDQDNTFNITAEADGVTEVFIIEGDNTLYTSKAAADISPKVLAANFDEGSKIYVRTTHSMSGKDINQFKLHDVAGNSDIGAAVTWINDYNIYLTVSDMSAIDVTKVYEVSSPDFKKSSVTMRRILDDTKYFYSGNDLGLNYTSGKSTFKVWAPTAKKVSVVLYTAAGTYNSKGEVTDHTGGTETVMSKGANGVWSLDLAGDHKGKYYMYKVEFANGTVNYSVDPYARTTSANGQRTAIVDLDATDPADWSKDSKPAMVSPADAILYELHVRDLSTDANSGITNKGKFKAFTENGTTYNGQKTGIDHIADLGVNFVHLLPVYDFKTVNELTVDDPASTDPKFNWGYDPQNYNVPEGSYSSDPTNPTARITEFKEMVSAFHKKDIRVVMDVVYNHTFSADDGPFNKVVPGYFYRTNEKGRYTNGSGCGNEVASERPMVSKYIKDSVKYWAREYNVDGFRFDLMGLIDVNTMSSLTSELKSEVDSSIIVYGEPWTAGSHAIHNGQSTVKGTQRSKGFSVFNDNIRGAIKGGSDDTSKGFATGDLSKIGGVVTGLKGGEDFTDAPYESISYVTAHDNLVLWDKILKTQGIDASNPYATVDVNNLFGNETVKRSILANGIVLTSQGMPFIHAGSEMLRTKNGDHNSYKSSDATNQIKWENKVKFKPVYDYYKGLIELRKNHPAFRMTRKDAVNSNLQVTKANDGIIVFQLKNYANNDTWENIVVVYNGNSASREVTLPSTKNWKVVVDNDQAGVETLRSFSGNTVMVEGVSMMVLYDNDKASTAPEKTVKVFHRREDENYTDWNLWVWDSGASDGQVNPTGEITIDGKKYLSFEFKVSSGVTRIGYMVRKGNWVEKDPGTDRFIDLDSNSNLTKVYTTSGTEAFEYVKQVSGPELNEGNVTLYYRDNGKYESNQMSTVTAVKVVMDGTEYAMNYDAKNEVFVKSFSNVADGLHNYYFNVTAGGSTTKQLDSYNTASSNGNSTFVSKKTAFDWDEARIYFMVTDRFNDGDATNNTNVDKSHLEAYHGGDFQGVINKLDYLQELGINTIWVTPIVDNIDYNQGKAFNGKQYGYHGYWAKDFTKLDEHLGDIATFKSLIDKAHDKGIKIMVDIVVNHAGYGMDPYESTMDGVLNLPSAAEREVFRDMFRRTPGTDAITMELAGLPDFITENLGIRTKLIQWQADWLDKAKTTRGDTIDFFRVDTVKHVEHETWKALKTALTAKDPNFKMIGEYYDGTVSNNGGYLGNGEMDSLLDFDFKHKAKQFVEGDLEAADAYFQSRNKGLSSDKTLGQFLSSHDEDGFLTRFSVDDARRTQIAMLGATLQMTLKGQVVVYYGEEIGLSGKNAKNMAQGQFSENRYDMIFDTANAKFNSTIFNHYKKMLNIRKEYSKVFSKGTRTKIAGSNGEGYLVFQRDYNGERVIVGVNNSDVVKNATIKTGFAVGTVVKDVYGGASYTVDSNQSVSVSMPKASDGGTLVLVKVK